MSFVCVFKSKAFRYDRAKLLSAINKAKETTAGALVFDAIADHML